MILILQYNSYKLRGSQPLGRAKGEVNGWLSDSAKIFADPFKSIDSKVFIHHIKLKLR